MAGVLNQKEQAIVTLESSGSSQANNTQVAASTANLDCRSGGNAAEMFYGDFELNGGFGSSPAVGAQINLYLVPALDGTNYADVDTTNHNMPPECFVGSFLVDKAATAAQRMVIMGVSLRPVLYKAYIDNQSAQTLSSTWTLKVVASEDQYT